MKNYDLKLYLRSKANLARMSETAKRMYQFGEFPENKKQDMLDLIAYLDSKLEHWLVF